VTGAVGHVLESVVYGFAAAGGVDDDGGHVAAGDVFYLFYRVVGRVDRVQDVEFFAAEVESRFVDVHGDDLAAGDAGGFHGAEADGAGADDEDELAGLDGRATDGVGADGEGFDEGELIMGEAVAVDEAAAGD